MPEAKKERPLSDLFSELSHDVQKLFRQEIELAKAELAQKAYQVSSSAKRIAIGALLASMGGLVLLAAVVLGLAEFMPVWVSAVIVGSLFLIIGGLSAGSGIRSLRKLDITPQRTVNTLNRDALWARKEANERLREV